MQSYSSAERQLIAAVAILLAATTPFWVYFLVFPSGYSYVAGLVSIPVLVIVNVFLIAWVSKEDALLAKLMPVAFVLKLAAAAIYLFLVQHVLNGGDVLAYHQYGSRIASDFLVTRDLASFTASPGVSPGGTQYISDLVALLYMVTGASISTGIVVFSMAAFWGQYIAYRAFTLAFPGGERDRVALLLFLFPSNVFWTATMGKDAIIGFFTCLAFYGFARLVNMSGIRAYLYLALGLAGALFVRPHVAAILGMAFLVAYVFGRNLRGFFGLAAKIVTIPLLGYGSVWLVTQAQRFLNAENFSKVLLVANTVSHNTNLGSSAINAPGSSLFSRIATSPFLLFRPFPWEVNNVQAAMASAEALILLWFFWVFRGHFRAAIRRWRSDPVLLFIFVYFIEFSVVVAGTFSNIGLIVRQRVMMVPFVLMLFCFSPRLRSTEALRRNLRARCRFESRIPA